MAPVFNMTSVSVSHSSQCDDATHVHHTVTWWLHNWHPRCTLVKSPHCTLSKATAAAEQHGRVCTTWTWPLVSIAPMTLLIMQGAQITQKHHDNCWPRLSTTQKRHANFWPRQSTIQKRHAICWPRYPAKRSAMRSITRAGMWLHACMQSTGHRHSRLNMTTEKRAPNPVPTAVYLSALLRHTSVCRRAQAQWSRA